MIFFEKGKFLITNTKLLGDNYRNNLACLTDPDIIN